MTKKHFIAIHTCFSEETRTAFIEHSKNLTHRQIIQGSKFEDAEMVSQWMGKEEFFYCHWLAEDEDAILSALEKIGINDIVVTVAYQMTRFIDVANQSDNPVGDPDLL